MITMLPSTFCLYLWETLQVMLRIGPKTIFSPKKTMQKARFSNAKAKARLKVEQRDPVLPHAEFKVQWAATVGVDQFASITIFLHAIKLQREVRAAVDVTFVSRPIVSRAISLAWHTKMRCPNRATTDSRIRSKVSQLQAQSFWNCLQVQGA